MKKTINIMLIGILLAFAFSCFTASVGAGSFEWVKNPHPAQQNGWKSPQERNRPNTETAEIYNVLPGPIQDDNFNLFCVSYNMAIFITVPPEGASFYLIEYYRIRGVGETEWGEWREIVISDFFFFSSEMADISHVEYRNGFWKEEGASFGPSEAELKTEIYSPDNELLDTFVSSFDNGYWPPRLESEYYDNEPSVYTPTPTPTPCGETPLPTQTPIPTVTPIVTPTPTPVVVGSIFGTVSNEKGKPLYDAKVTAVSGNFFSDKTRTDKDGGYSFEGLDAQKEYSVTAKKTSYDSKTEKVFLDEEREQVDFALEKSKK